MPPIAKTLLVLAGIGAVVVLGGTIIDTLGRKVR